MNVERKIVRGVLLALALTSPIASASMAYAKPNSGAEPAVDQAAVANLANSVAAALDALPAAATKTDMTAAITFAIDQSKQPVAIAKAALDAVKAKKQWSAVVLSAIASVYAQLGSNGGTGGTGGIGGGGAASGLGGGPGVGGGGGTDYSTNR